VLIACEDAVVDVMSELRSGRITTAEARRRLNAVRTFAH
jgi:hypothetical protein